MRRSGRTRTVGRQGGHRVRQRISKIVWQPERGRFPAEEGDGGKESGKKEGTGREGVPRDVADRRNVEK